MLVPLLRIANIAYITNFYAFKKPSVIFSNLLKVLVIFDKIRKSSEDLLISFKYRKCHLFEKSKSMLFFVTVLSCVLNFGCCKTWPITLYLYSYYSSWQAINIGGALFNGETLSFPLDHKCIPVSLPGIGIGRDLGRGLMRGRGLSLGNPRLPLNQGTRNLLQKNNI